MSLVIVFKKSEQLNRWLLLGVLLLSTPGFVYGSDVDTGRKFFKTYCSSCHGLDGKGAGPAATALKSPPPDLTKILRRRDSVWTPDEIAAIIDGRSAVAAHGSREMPVWGKHFGEQVGGGQVGEEVTRGNIAVLVEYLKSIQK